MIYLSSDLHFGHNREFIYGARGFSNVEEMNEAIVERFNSVIKEDDDLYLLGDLMLGDNNNIDYVKRLNGRIHIVLGNHDGDTREQLYKTLPNVVEIEKAIHLRYKKLYFYLSHFPAITENFDNINWWNLHGHIHSNQIQAYPQYPATLHVGVDATNCYPISIENLFNNFIIPYGQTKSI